MRINDLSPKLAEHCRRFNVRTLDVFGSRSRDEEKPGSDLDLLVEFEELPPAQYARNYFGLLHSLEDDLPFKIDLLTTPSLRRPSLKSSLERDRIRIYET